MSTTVGKPELVQPSPSGASVTSRERPFHLWSAIAALYMAGMTFLCFLVAIDLIRHAEGYMPLAALAILQLLAGLLAALAALALAARKSVSVFLFWSFCLSWATMAFVMNSIFVPMCSTETEQMLGLVIVTFVPTGIGFLLVRNARRAQ